MGGPVGLPLSSFLNCGKTDLFFEVAQIGSYYINFWELLNKAASDAV